MVLIIKFEVMSVKLTLTKIFVFLFSILVLNSGLIFAQNRQPLKQKLNLVSRKLEFARELQATYRNQATVEDLNSADARLNRAREYLQTRRPLLANQLINEAESLINQAMRALLKEPLRLRRESLDQKIQIAEKVVRKSNIQEAGDLLDKGIENKTIAEQSFQAGEFQKAIRHLRKAEFQVQKSIDWVTDRDQSTEAKARDEAQQFDQLAAQTESIISKSADQGVQKNYRLAIKLSEKAKKANANANYREAIDFYHQATRLLLRTRDLAEGKIDRSATQAYEEVAALDELVETIYQRVQPFEDDERIQFFMSHIEQLQEDAHKALEEQDYKLVLLNTQYARDLVERVQKRLRGESNESAELINQELGQLESDLNEINVRLIAQGINEEANILLAYARFAKVKAGELLKQQNYRFARESILIANSFASSADRLIRKQNTEVISSEAVLNKVEIVEKEIASSKLKIAASTELEAQPYFNHAQKMLNLARENANKNFPFVANECLKSSQSALEKLKAILE